MVDWEPAKDYIVGRIGIELGSSMYVSDHTAMTLLNTLWRSRTSRGELQEDQILGPAGMNIVRRKVRKEIMHRQNLELVARKNFLKAGQ